MAVGNCTDEDVEYDVVPTQGNLRFSPLVAGGFASTAAGIALLLSRVLPSELTPVLGGGLAVLGILLIMGGSFLRLRDQLVDLRRQAQREETATTKSQAVGTELHLKPSTLQKKLLPAHAMDETTPFTTGQRVRFCKPHSHETVGAGSDEIATVHIGSTKSHVEYQGASEELMGAPVAGVILRYEDEQYRVELLAA